MPAIHADCVGNIVAVYDECVFVLLGQLVLLLESQGSKLINCA